MNGMAITKVLKSGYKVVTSTTKGALGEKNLTETLTNVYAPNGKLVLSRNKGVFKNWDSGSTMMKLPDGIKGNFIARNIEIYPPNILGGAPKYDSVSITKDTFRPKNAGNMSFVSGSTIDQNGHIYGHSLKYNEPIKTAINPEKHSIVKSLIKKVFG